jgi:hypothetical protein
MTRGALPATVLYVGTGKGWLIAPELDPRYTIPWGVAGVMGVFSVNLRSSWGGGRCCSCGEIPWPAHSRTCEKSYAARLGELECLSARHCIRMGADWGSPVSLGLYLTSSQDSVDLDIGRNVYRVRCVTCCARPARSTYGVLLGIDLKKQVGRLPETQSKLPCRLTRFCCFPAGLC